MSATRTRWETIEKLQYKWNSFNYWFISILYILIECVFEFRGHTAELPVCEMMSVTLTHVYRPGTSWSVPVPTPTTPSCLKPWSAGPSTFSKRCCLVTWTSSMRSTGGTWRYEGPSLHLGAFKAFIEKKSITGSQGLIFYSVGEGPGLQPRGSQTQWFLFN